VQVPDIQDKNDDDDDEEIPLIPPDRARTRVYEKRKALQEVEGWSHTPTTPVPTNTVSTNNAATDDSMSVETPVNDGKTEEYSQEL
jgi:hypothetical protein